MTYIIVVGADPISGNWHVIDRSFHALPIPTPVIYSNVLNHPVVPLARNLGHISIRHAVTGAMGVGTVFVF